jgi:probable HAF family extracellular repeat protein
MKSSFSTRVLATTLLAATTIPGGTAAQEHLQTLRHHHYKLIDVGTFGGAGGGIEGPASPSLNQRGVLVGESGTASPDPFAPDCFFDCFIDLGFLVRDGVVTRLYPPASGAGLSSIAYAINNSSEVVGQAENGSFDSVTGWPQTHAVFWRRGRSTAIDLGTLGGTQSIANVINNSGQVVGAALTAKPDPFANAASSLGCESPNAYGIAPSTFAECAMFYPGTTETHAFLWQNGVMRDLHTLGGPDSNAFAINERGEVAEDGMIDLGGLGGTAGAVVWINDRGQIAGVSNTSGDVTTHPFIWSKWEGMQDLFEHGGLGGTFGHPDWINDAGEVVGYATLAGELGAHAFLWRNGVMTDLGTLGTDDQSEASFINSHAQIVGGTFNDSGDLRGFLWEHDGPMVDLNTLIVSPSGMYVRAATLINDRGEIGCLGEGPGDTLEHACLLVPCDENHPDIEDCDYSWVDERRIAGSITPNTSREMPRAPPTRTARNHRGGILGLRLPSN